MKSSPADAKPQTEVNDAERLKQIAKRKEQNRNAQRRLRERKEEYTMQLEAQVAELHRRSQTQEEHSHYLREMLERIRAENQMLSQQLAIATHSPDTMHRSSIDTATLVSNAGQPFIMNRPRHASESDTSSSRAAAPWPHAGVAPLQHLDPTALASHGSVVPPLPPTSANTNALGGLPAAANTFGLPALLHPTAASVARLPEYADASQSHPGASRKNSTSPITLSGDLLSPTAVRGSLHRYSSGQTEITIPSEGSDGEGPDHKLPNKALEPGATGITSMDVDSTTESAAQQVASSRGDFAEQTRAAQASAMFARGLQEHRQAATTTADQCMQSWLGIGVEPHHDLSLSSMPSNDHLQGRPLGATPGALGLSSNGDGWTISPWVSFIASPTDTSQTKVSAAPPSGDRNAWPSEASRSASLALRRGFSGKLDIEPHALQ